MIDTELIISASKGDEIALNRLLNQWYQPAFRYAMKYFGDYDTAMEITQKCFIKIASSITDLRDPEYFKSWFYRILSNQCHEEIRRSKSKKLSHWLSSSSSKSVSISEPHLANHLSRSEHDSDHAILQSEKNDLVQSALNNLNEDQKAVLILKHYEDLTFKEIAQTLNIPENTAKTRLYMALKRLKNEFEQNEQIKEELWYE